MKALSIDPSFSATGWAVVENGIVLSSGAFKNDADLKETTTRTKIAKQRAYTEHLIKLITETKPDIVYSEYPHGGQELQSAWVFGVVTTTIIAVTTCLGLQAKFCLESQAKKCLFGRAKNVEKSQVRQKILAIYGKNGYFEDKRKYVAEAVADALAVYTFFTLNKGI